jgi:hypothetical protein
MLTVRFLTLEVQFLVGMSLGDTIGGDGLTELARLLAHERRFVAAHPCRDEAVSTAGHLARAVCNVNSSFHNFSLT